MLSRRLGKLREQGIMVDQIKIVAVLGLGRLGAQIALQAAACGYQVLGFDPDQTALQHSLHDFLTLDQKQARSNTIQVDKWAQAAEQVQQLPSLEQAVSQADLVIEVVPEKLDIKLKVWKQIEESAPAHAILATNSSSMPVSKLEGAVSRPEQCLNLHFYQPVIGQNMADVMGGSKTTSQVLEAGKEFVRSLGMIPLKVNKELLGFCFNRVWRAIKKESLYMWAQGFVDFRDIDRGWMVFSGTPWGPFGLMDTVGLDVIWDIEMIYYNESGDPKDHPPQALKDLIDAGHLGVKSGRGFYSYPDPEFSQDDFLKP